MRPVLTAFWLGILGYALWVSGSELRAFSDERYSILDLPPLAELDSRMIDILSFGHRGLWDDFVSIWTLQFLFDDRLVHEDPDQIFQSLTKVSRHHPKVESFYMTACFQMSSLFKRPGACEQIILDGLKAFPESWRLPQVLAWVYAYQMKDWRQAATFFGLASSRPGSPEFLKKLTANLLERQEISAEELTSAIRAVVDGAPEGSKLMDFLSELETKRRGRHAQEVKAP